MLSTCTSASWIDFLLVLGIDSQWGTTKNQVVGGTDFDQRLVWMFIDFELEIRLSTPLQPARQPGPRKAPDSRLSDWFQSRVFRAFVGQIREEKNERKTKKRRTGGQSGVVGGETRIGRAGAVPGAVRRPRVGQGDAVGRRQVGGAVDVLGAAGEAAGRRVRRGHAVRPRRRHGAAHLDVVALRWWPVAGVAAAAEQQEGVGVGGDGGGVQRAQDVVDGKGGRFQFGTGGHVDRTAHGRRRDRHDR